MNITFNDLRSESHLGVLTFNAILKKFYKQYVSSQYNVLFLSLCLLEIFFAAFLIIVSV